MNVVRVTEAKAQLSALMARAGYGGERFLIERRGRPLAARVGVEDLERLEDERGGVSPRSSRRGRWHCRGLGAGSRKTGRSTRLEEIYTPRDRYRTSGGPRRLDVSARHRHSEQPHETRTVDYTDSQGGPCAAGATVHVEHYPWGACVRGHRSGRTEALLERMKTTYCPILRTAFRRLSGPTLRRGQRHSRRVGLP